VVAQGVLERRRGLILLAVADQHMRVEVDHQRVDALAAGDSRPGERPPGGFRAPRPPRGPAARAPATADSRRSSSASNSRQQVESDATGPNSAG
jgi:hypothetical protein